jgi:hypothetical protein
MSEANGWECPVCHCWLGYPIELCQGLLLDEADGGDTQHPPVANPLTLEERYAAARADLTELAYEFAEARAENARLRESIRNPTQWAYDQACRALWKHREHATRLEAENARLREALAALSDDYERLCGDGMTADTAPPVLNRARAVLSAATGGASDE